MHDTDLSGLDPAGAREYVLQFLTTLRQTRRRREELERERETWTGRVRLATERGEPQLRDAARGELARVQEHLGRLLQEETELEASVAVLGDQLRLLAHRHTPAVDTAQLLSALEAAGGEHDPLADELDRMAGEQKLSAELDALKRKLDDDGA